VPDPPADVLDRQRRLAGLSHGELWVRYFGLGGMHSDGELRAILSGTAGTSAHDHDVIARALNERFVELGGNHLVPYAGGGP